MASETAITAATTTSPLPGAADARNGVFLVFGAAPVWSFSGAIARGLGVQDPWTIIAWRSFFAALFLIGFMLWRDGPAGTVRRFRTMGLPGIGVALCFATASISFVVALGDTSVANILLMQAGVPLIAAFLGVVFLREAVDRVSWAAILPVMAGIGVMVSDSFATGARLIPSAFAALISTMEPVLGPVWVWLIHAEVPAPRTLVGGGRVFLALVGHILWQWHMSRRTALPLPT